MAWPFTKKKKKKKLTGMAAAGQTSGRQVKDKSFEGSIGAGMSAIKKRRQRMGEMQKELGY